MTAAESLLEELAALGTEQNRKIYARHGAHAPMYGVSYAHLGKLQKRLRRDHSLAIALWQSGVHDARVLATMIADPAMLSGDDARHFVRDLDNGVLAGALAKLVAAAPPGAQLALEWCASPDEWISCTGFATVACLAQASDLPDDWFLPLLATIEQEIHSRPNRTRETMNQALIAIGIRSAALRARALAVAAQIGKVEVDHGETHCKTPDAAEYIARTLERQRTHPKKSPAAIEKSDRAASKQKSTAKTRTATKKKAARRKASTATAKRTAAKKTAKQTAVTRELPIEKKSAAPPAKKRSRSARSKRART